MAEEITTQVQEPVQAQAQTTEQQFVENSDGMLVPTQTTTPTEEVTTPEVDTPQDVQPENVEGEPKVETVDKDIKDETVELSKSEYNKLKEYELANEERSALQERLGLQDVNPAELNYVTLDQQVVNKGQQELLRLCNAYGVDADPDKFQASVEGLKQSNPQKGYELERKIEQLMYSVDSKRQQIAFESSNSQVKKFAQENQQLLNASPVINQILTEYVQYNQGNPNMYENLNMINNYLVAVCKEAFEAGTKYQANEKAKADTSKVQGGIVNAPQAGYVGEEHIFTRAELSRMSDADFAKNEKKITEQMTKGLIV